MISLSLSFSPSLLIWSLRFCAHHGFANLSYVNSQSRQPVQDKIVHSNNSYLVSLERHFSFPYTDVFTLFQIMLNCVLFSVLFPTYVNPLIRITDRSVGISCRMTVKNNMMAHLIAIAVCRGSCSKKDLYCN